jgi:hypothetical protein
MIPAVGLVINVQRITLKSNFSGDRMIKYFRTAFALSLVAFASLLLVVSSSAQSAIYGTIVGTVTDKTGAAVPGATVTVTDIAKGTVTSQKTNAAGDFTVPYLVPDVYNVKISFTGFKTFEAKSLQVLADTAPRIDAKLEVGVQTTTVEVNAESQPELKTETTDVATVFNDQQVSSLPVGDQNFTNLQLLLPGAQLLGWSHAADENPQASKQIQIDGQAFGGVAFDLDGADNQDPILGIIVVNPAMDAVTQTTITTQNFNAEQGKAVSAAVSAQTKSGTNKFHGSIYDFRTGNANLAKEPFSMGADSKYPAGLKNRFGVSIGGPVLKDRFFFFFNYEGQRSKVGTTAIDTLPTALLTETALGKTTGPGGIPGADFSQYLALASGAGVIYDNTALGTGAAYTSNVIPTAELSAQSLALLTYLEPYTTGITTLDSNYGGQGTGLFNSNQYTARVDYTISQKASAFVRFARFTDTLSGTVMFGAAGGPGFGIGGYGGNSTGANDSTVAGMDYAFSPKLFTDFRLGYLRYNVIDSKHDQSAEFANTLGIPGINMGTYFTGGAPGFVLDKIPSGNQQPLYGDGLGVNRCNCPLTEREDQFQIINNWTRNIGNHAVKVGYDLRYGRNLRVPSDTDRAGELDFSGGPTSNGTTGGLSMATFMLGEVTHFGRYVSTSTNAKEFQKRTFFYAQDTWHVNHKLTLNYGVRWELYFPESVNAVGNGALMDLSTGYIHVAGVGSVPSNMGWGIQKSKMFEPRAGLSYQLDSKTVIRAGYGRSFDIGVFGSVFGHVVTQNLPVLANQSINGPGGTGYAFSLAAGPAAPVPVAVPSSGLLPNPGASVSTKARPNPMRFPTLDAWNLSLQRQISPSMTVTLAYVGNKGTHTLADGDGNNTNPNEAAINLPGQYGVNGQSLSYAPPTSQYFPIDPITGKPSITINNANQTWASNVLQRYYGLTTLAACNDSNYTQPGSGYGDITLPAGACGWTNGIQYYGNNQNTNYNSFRATIDKKLAKGLAGSLTYAWASAFSESNGYWTWSHHVTYGHDSNVRKQQLSGYGSYDLPFGKGKQFLTSANKVEDLIIGGFQLSGVLNWASGLPFSLGVNSCSDNIPGSAPCYANLAPGTKLHTSLTGYDSSTKHRTFYAGQPALYVNPGLGNIGNVERNSYFGPSFFNTDLGLTKAFNVWESVNIKFRMDAFNAFNHINPGNPGGNIQNEGTITGEAPGPGPRQLEFSLHAQF